MPNIEVKDNGTQRALFIDGVCQGVVDMNDMTPLSPYMGPIIKIIDALPKDSRAIFFGGGACLLPTYAELRYVPCLVLENNKDVKDTAVNYFGANPDNIVITKHADTWLVDRNINYDLIFLDVWPQTKEFYSPLFFSLCKSSLTDRGVFAVNHIPQDQEDTVFMGRFLATVFPNVRAFNFFKDKEKTQLIQTVFVCDSIIGNNNESIRN